MGGSGGGGLLVELPNGSHLIGTCGGVSKTVLLICKSKSSFVVDVAKP